MLSECIMTGFLVIHVLQKSTITVHCFLCKGSLYRPPREMVTREYAKRARWQGAPTTQLLQSTNHQPKVWNTVSYQITLVDIKGTEYWVQVYEIEQITRDIDPLPIPAGITLQFRGRCRLGKLPGLMDEWIYC